MSDENDYDVTVSVRETFNVRVRATTAREAEEKVWVMDYDEGDAQSHGDRKWTRVKARRAE